MDSPGTTPTRAADYLGTGRADWSGDVISAPENDRLSMLRAARDRLIEAMNGDLICRSCARGVDPPLPSVIRELRAVLTEIDQVPGSGEVTSLDLIAGHVTDQLAARRTTKRTAG